MKKFQKILVVVDTTADQHPALDQAVKVAEANQASLLVVDVVPNFTWPQKLLLTGSDHLRDLLAKEKNDRLKKLIAPLQQRGMAVREKVLVGKTSVEIIRQVVREKHDLVIRTSKGIRSRRRGYLGATSLELLRNCPCTVWLISANKTHVHRIAAAVDATPDDEAHAALNRHILETTSAAGALLQSRWDVLHVWNIYGERIVKDYMKTADFADLERATREECRASLTSLVQPWGIAGDSDRLHLLRGDPATEIASFVDDQKIDLLVMGTVARRGVTGWIVGNTAEQVFGELNCSVLAVKPEEFETRVTD